MSGEGSSRRARALAVGVALAAAVSVRAQTPLTTIPVAWGLEQLVYATHPPDDFARIFTVQQDGDIRIIKNGVPLPNEFLDLSALVQPVGEQGLLGLAFDPAYASNGYFYVHYSGPVPSNNGVVARYKVSANPDVADPGSGVTVLTIAHVSKAHYGGWLDFGPDGYLYISSGDGDLPCTEIGGAQTTTSLLGKILRINVASLPYTIPPSNPFATGGGRPEIWALGLRNPWQASFDRATGDLWIGDVGNDAWEEVDILPPGAPPPQMPRNFGWPCREAFVCSCSNSPCPAGCTSPAFVNPLHAYPHSQGCAITGGSVYRGCAIPDLQGTYFFGDFCSGRIWTFRYVGGVVTGLTERTNELEPPGGWNGLLVSGFGEDAFGEIYICHYNGILYKVVPESLVGPDCNSNARRDACDIASGYSMDNNANGVPDECDCYPNCNASYTGPAPSLTIADFACFQAKYVTGHPYADCNHSGTLTIADFGCFQAAFVGGCP